jgi:hypothetical protein
MALYFVTTRYNTGACSYASALTLLDVIAFWC